MRRKAADEVQMMTTTTSPGGERPVRVILKADVSDYVEQATRLAIDSLIADGMTVAEATDWVIRSNRSPASAEALRHYRQRWVTGVEEADPVDWVSEEVLDELEAQLLEQKERSSRWRRLYLGEWTETDRA